MRRAGFALLLALCGCSVAPPVQPYMRVGQPLIKRLAEMESSSPAAAVKGYLEFIQSQAEFDRDFDHYARTYIEDLKTISQDKSVDEAPINGHYYIYNERVAGMARAHFGLARAYLAQKEFIRAERAALAGGRLADMRAWEKLVSLEAQRDQWELLVEIYKQAGLKNAMELSRHRLAFFQDQLRRTDPPNAHKRYFDEAKKAYKELAKEELFIHQANERRRSEVAGGVTAGMGIAVAGMQTWADANLPKYDGQERVSKMNMAQAQNFINIGMAQAGRFGNYVAFAYAASGPAMIQAFTNPNAGVQPMALVEEFSQRAQSMGLSDHVLVQLADATHRGAAVLDRARKGGDPGQIKAAFDNFMPAYDKLASRLQKGKEKGLRQAGEAEEGGDEN